MLECGDLFEEAIKSIMSEVTSKLNKEAIKSISDIKTVVDQLKLTFNDLQRMRTIRRVFKVKV